MILESIVTTISEEGHINIAPMGPLVENMFSERPKFTLRPFVGSQTCNNLTLTQRAAIHVTDDALLFAMTAVGSVDHPQKLVRPVLDGDFQVLIDCHRWFAVEITSVESHDIRLEMQCEVIQSGVKRPFFGFNRAKHAVIEAAILATRTHLISREIIESEIERLTPMIDKTAGTDEQQAFLILKQTIHERLQSHTANQ